MTTAYANPLNFYLKIKHKVVAKKAVRNSKPTKLSVTLTPDTMGWDLFHVERTWNVQAGKGYKIHLSD